MAISFSFDFGGLDVARLVPPGTADVGQNRRNLGVGELLERLHRGIGRPFSTVSIGSCLEPVTTLLPASAGPSSPRAPSRSPGDTRRSLPRRPSRRGSRAPPGKRLGVVGAAAAAAPALRSPPLSRQPWAGAAPPTWCTRPASPRGPRSACTHAPCRKARCIGRGTCPPARRETMCRAENQESRPALRRKRGSTRHG